VLQPDPGANCQTSTYFSRRGGDAEPLIAALNQAQKSIGVAIYGLTHPGIVDALMNAKARGLDVALKTDKLQSAGRTQSAMISKLEAAGIPLKCPSKRGCFIISLP
jgi:phosphatidylserine/phosphatidylglycerophosphate/cardiolipin synthase-like enzyme